MTKEPSLYERPSHYLLLLQLLCTALCVCKLDTSSQLLSNNGQCKFTQEFLVFQAKWPPIKGSGCHTLGVMQKSCSTSHYILRKKQERKAVRLDKAVAMDEHIHLFQLYFATETTLVRERHSKERQLQPPFSYQILITLNLKN